LPWARNNGYIVSIGEGNKQDHFQYGYKEKGVKENTRTEFLIPHASEKPKNRG
jgi:hypothetical protein